MSKLQREVVVRTALKLLNEVGMDGLTTRRLARELGVQSPALYWHFKDKRELLDAVADAMLAENHTCRVPPEGADWRAWLGENARSFRRALLAYRDGARIHAGTRPGSGMLPAVEAQARLLCGAGFAPVDALRALVLLGRYVLGWVSEEQADAADAADRGGEGFPAGSLTGFPLLAAGMAEFDKTSPDENFDHGLRIIIAGLEAGLRGELPPNQA